MQVPYFLIFLALWIASIVLAWPVWLMWVLGVLTFAPLVILLLILLIAGTVSATARRRF